MDFVKMHGLGNDFIVIENLNEEINSFNDIAVKVCNRHFGVGADGILVVGKSNKADIKMDIINSDGSVAEMCGNGIRCFCKYVYEKNIVKKEVMEVETLAGVLTAYMKVQDSKVALVKVDMGKPEFDKNKIPFTGCQDNLLYSMKVNDKKYYASTILMGVPHTVIYVDSIDLNEVESIGRKIEKLDIFPSKTNVDFIEVIDKETIRIRTWERGAGMTLACGTGTCASVVTSYINNKTSNKVTAILEGGNLYIDYDGENVYMEGPAEFICQGKIVF